MKLEKTWKKCRSLMGILFLSLLLVSNAAATTETVLHIFSGSPTDGANPYAGLTLDNAGNLYGTTLYGGADNRGTLFKLDTSNNLTVLHSFSLADGAYPYAGLIRDAAGNLYGTTQSGSGSVGTIFKLDTSNNLTVLHTFSGADGALPYAELTRDAVGNLYGTTYYGGANNNGTVFKLDTSNNLTVLHTFSGGSTDGAYPSGGLIMDSMGNLFGTTARGGVGGTVFELDTRNNFSVLYNFSGVGSYPYAGLIFDSAGNLYGTTNAGAGGNGVVFKLAITYTLTYATGAHGTISGMSPQTVNYGGSGTAVTAVPITGYHFANWSDGSTANPRTDSNVTTNLNVTANFAINSYMLTYTAGAHGTISGTSPQTVNYGASGTAVKAVPNTGYHFENWSDGSTANPRTDTNVTASITVTANFVLNPITASCPAINAVRGARITPVTLKASGGVGGPYTFSATGLPRGLTMSSSGTISGTPTVSGTFYYTVTITDSAHNKGTIHCSIKVK